ncbi:MAG: ATP-binding protein [Gammaproteobacteria bacterium]|nr:ATP-binding protein [Gammaproteobacteria bacterium]MDH5594239.1 ATP-binding protein [Gammaproteobacteria bacterium]
MQTHEEKIKARIFVPVILALVSVALVSIFSYYQLQSKQIDNDIHWRIHGVDAAYKKALENETATLDGLIGFLLSDKDIQAAWLSRDRQRLYQQVLPAYKRLFIDNKITHFYFIEKDKVCFLREHNKSRYGDVINRFTLDRAIATNKKASGVELGPLGTFTLRVVHPWYINGELTGYLELGIEITHITPQLRKLFGVELFVLVKKEYLERKKWEEGRRMLNQEQDWDRYNDFVVVESSISEKKIAVEAYQKHIEAQKKNIYSSDAHDLETVGRIYRAGFSPLIDAGNRDVGEFITLADVTTLKTRLWKTTTQTIMISFFILVALIGSFYFYISRLERRFVDAHHRVLNESIMREKAMEEARNTAVSISQMKSEFISNMSHEIRTPLNAVNGMLQLLQESEINEDQRQYTDIAIGASHELIRLIDGILDHIKLGAGEFQLNMTDFDLPSLIRGEVNEFKENVLEKEVKLSLQISEQVPETMHSDPERLRQILHNLIDNAVKFTDDGKITVTLDVVMEDDSSSMLCIKVHNTGAVIQEDAQEKIFEMFTQADGSITRSHGGLGLGLAVTSRLTQILDGRISLQSDLEHGTTFSVFLPI